MKPRPNFQLHPNESVSAVIVRMYKHIRSIQGHIEVNSHYAGRIKSKKALKHLKLVK